MVAGIYIFILDINTITIPFLENKEYSRPEQANAVL